MVPNSPIVVRRGEEEPPRRGGGSGGWMGVPAAIAVLAGMWIAAASAGGPVPVPGPAPTLAALRTLVADPALPPALITTLATAGGGFLIALATSAIAASVFSGALRLAGHVVLGLPAMLLIPMGILVLGMGTAVGLIGATMLAFGPMMVGFATDYGARRPAAAVGAAMALNGTLAAEITGGAQGLGAMALQAVIALDMAKAAAIALMLGAIGVVAVLAVHVVFAAFVADDRPA